MAIFESAVFASRHKLKAQTIYAVLVVTAISLTVARIFMPPRPRTRANTLALSMGAKSLVVLAYEISTESVQRLRRFASPKANLILNCLEVIFWGAVAGFLFQANLNTCVGVTCKLSWTVLALAVVLSNVAVYLTLMSFRDFRESWRTKYSERIITPSSTESGSGAVDVVELRSAKR